MTAVLRSCPQSENCPPNDPLGNFSSESNDTLDYISTAFAYLPPLLLVPWSATECARTFISTVSQEDADMQALAAAELCIITGTWNGPVVYNTAQSCCFPCGDGTQFCFTVPAGTFAAINQATADQIAKTWACKVGPNHKICLSGIPQECCLNQSFSATIVATGPKVQGFGNGWFVSGILPPGLTLSSTGGTSATIHGTPTSDGTYIFSVGVILSSGDRMTKVFSLCVVGINPVNSTLPGATQGTAYSTNVTSTSCTVSPTSWKVLSGALPSGLSLNATTGQISGTPTTAGNYNFTIGLTAP